MTAILPKRRVATVSTIDAARARFRPIVMTTVAMNAVMLPLALGQSAAADFRRAVGIVGIGGLSTSLLLTLAVVPTVYIWYRGLPLRPVIDNLALPKMVIPEA